MIPFRPIPSFPNAIDVIKKRPAGQEVDGSMTIIDIRINNGIFP